MHEHENAFPARGSCLTIYGVSADLSVHDMQHELKDESSADTARWQASNS